MAAMDNDSLRLKSNPPKLYAYKFVSEFYLVVPCLIAYYVLNGLNATQIFTVQAAFHVAVLLLEVPSGYVADVLGRKTTLIIAAVFFTRIGTAAASMFGGFLAVRSLHLPFYVNVVTYCLMLPIVLTLTEPPRRQRRARNPQAPIFQNSCCRSA